MRLHVNALSQGASHAIFAGAIWWGKCLHSPQACPVVTASAGSALPAGKVAVFYVLRAALAVTSAYAEARLVR